jgi:hypothetical protein
LCRLLLHYRKSRLVRNVWYRPAASPLPAGANSGVTLLPNSENSIRPMNSIQIEKANLRPTRRPAHQDRLHAMLHYHPPYHCWSHKQALCGCKCNARPLVFCLSASLTVLHDKQATLLARFHAVFAGSLSLRQLAVRSQHEAAAITPVLCL